MIEITIPGSGNYRLSHLVLDYNGTLACDGMLLSGVKDRLMELSKKLQVHVITADTFGKAKDQLKGIPCKLSVLPITDQDIRKMKYVEELGNENCVCIGNGRNDKKMLEIASLGIAVIQEEGASKETIFSADVVTRDILSALDLLKYPFRLIATLRL